MKPNARLTLLVSLLVLPFSGHPAQPAGAPPLLQSGVDLRQAQNYSVIQRGPHHRVMAAVTWTTNATGRITARTNSYTEIAIGMNALKDGTWVESGTEIEIIPGGALARKGPHTVSFAADLSTPGAIDCTTPDGKRLRSSIVGLGYRDASTGNSVLIAELKSSVGELLPSRNQVLYPDAFTNLQADVLYTYTKASLEQDVILREQPPSPSEFGLDPRTTRLEVITEFHDPPAPITTSAAIEPQRRLQPLAPGQATGVLDAALADQTVSFGAMQLGRGKAFMVGSEPSSPARFGVGKSWQQTDGRSFLIEEVKYEAIQPQIQALPRPAAPPQTGGSRQGALLRVSPHRLVPPVRMAGHSTNAMLLATSAALGRGFVLDYNLSGSLSNFTFQGDTTYCVVGQVLLSGLTQIEGGSVIKFPADNVSLTVAGGGAIQCLTSPYRPAIFTAKDDNTVGAAIAGSTGVPTNYYGGIALDLSAVSSPAISNAHFSFLNNALAGTGVVLRDAQISRCLAGFAAAVSHPSLYNVLIYRVNTLVDAVLEAPTNDPPLTVESVIAHDYVLINPLVDAEYEDYPGDILTAEDVTAYYCSNPLLDAEYEDYPGEVLTAENVTAHYCTNLMADLTSTIRLTNCLFACVGSWQCSVMLTNNNVILSSDADVFQTVGAGSHYLADQSPYRNAGTTNIDSMLLADLRKKTTYPPILYSNVLITADTTLWPQAQRDTDTPDLGYHFDPIDYLVSCCVSNATLTLANGVAVGYFDRIGVWLDNGGRLVSCGTPVQRNYLVHYNLVQEQPVNLAAPYGLGTAIPINPAHTDSSRKPSVALRFTTLVAPVGATYIAYTGDGTWEISAFDLQDCEVYGAGADWYQNGDPAGSVITLRNNLFRYANVDLWSAGQVTTYNNLFSGTTNNWSWFINMGTTPFTHTDNAFDGYSVYVDGTVGHNAYLNGATLLSDLQTNDIVTNLTWVTGPLGNYYQPTNSPLIDQGSRSAADAGLYHYTTQTNQVKETTSVVDIGYHYVAVDANGKPIDTDGENVPDYLEDANGNGVVDSGERDWQHSENGTTGVSGLKVFTPLK